MNIEKALDRFIHITGLQMKAQVEIDHARYAEEMAKKRCGNCDKWMKSRECPQEKSSMTGYSKGPNMNGFPCSEFVESVGVQELRDKAKLHRQNAEEILKEARAK